MKLRLKMDKKAVFGTFVMAAVAAAILFQHATPLADSNQPPEKTKVRLRDNSYYYGAFNRRDPFESLIVGDFVSNKKMPVVDVGRVVLVGIVKGDLDRFALLEDDKGFSYILRVGDEGRNGSVVAIGDRSVVARVTNFGQTRKFTLLLAKREEGELR